MVGLRSTSSPRTTTLWITRSTHQHKCDESSQTFDMLNKVFLKKKFLKIQSNLSPSWFKFKSKLKKKKRLKSDLRPRGYWSKSGSLKTKWSRVSSVSSHCIKNVVKSASSGLQWVSKSLQFWSVSPKHIRQNAAEPLWTQQLISPGTGPVLTASFSITAPHVVVFHLLKTLLHHQWFEISRKQQGDEMNTLLKKKKEIPLIRPLLEL